MNKENFKKYADAEQCPVRNILDRFGDKWSFLVLLILGEAGRMRFSELQKCIDNVSQKMLTVTLKKLETDALIKRTVYPQVPPKVEYELTELGESLLPNLINLVNWAKVHMDEILSGREKF